MPRRLLRVLAVSLAFAAVVAGGGWTIATVPAVREAVAEAFNSAAEAYIRFVFALYQHIGGSDAPS